MRSGACLCHPNTGWMRLEVCCDLTGSIELCSLRDAILCVLVCTGEDHGDGGDGVWSLLFVVEVEMCLKMGRAVHKLTECLIRRMWLLPQLTARSSSRK